MKTESQKKAERQAQHPGKIFYLGRWRTREEVNSRIRNDPSMRGVAWRIMRIDDVLYDVGRKGGFRIALRIS